MTENGASKKAGYLPHEIKRLSDLQHVRKRPAMYIGSTTRQGVHHLIEEVIDMMLDCYRDGRVSFISVELGKEGSVTCSDDNTQCELKVHDRLSQENDRETTNLEGSVGSLIIGGTGESIFNPHRPTRGSLHGISIVVTNFLSDRFSVQACSENEVFQMDYLKGEPQNPVKVSPRTTESGTRISFTPDTEIFSDEAKAIDGEQLRNRLEILAYLNPGLKIRFTDLRSDQEDTFHCSRGLRDYLRNRGHLAEPFREPKPILLEAKTEEIEFEIAIQPRNSVVSYVNDTGCGRGNHVTSFFTTVRDVLNEIGFRREYISDEDKSPTAQDYELQLQGVMALRMEHPQWTDQRRSTINNEFVDFFEIEVKPKLIAFFESEEELTRQLVYGAVSMAKER